MFLLYTVAGSILLCIGSAEHGERVEGRSRHSYPSPVTHYSLCGRQEQSYVCDPDTVMSVSEGLLILLIF